MSEVIHEMMTAVEVVNLFDSIDMDMTDHVFQSLHRYNANSHLVYVEGVEIEVQYSQRTKQYLVSMWA